MISIIIITVVFALLGIIFALGKGGFLIAGYNTSTKEEKEKYNLRRMTACLSVFSFAMSILCGLTGYVNTETFATHVMAPGIFILVAFLLIMLNTYCKK